MDTKRIALIGSGGKTTALSLLARQSPEKSLLVTTTTHIFPMEPPACRVCLADPTPLELAAALEIPGIVCAGSKAKEGKLGILPAQVLASGCSAQILYEADGSRHLPLKLHRPGEPVILPQTGRCVVIAGLSALGKPVDQAVHRYQLTWAREPRRTVGTGEFLHCVLETIASSGIPHDRLRIFLNQLDALQDPSPAEALRRALEARGLNARAGSLQDAPEDFYAWVTA